MKNFFVAAIRHEILDEAFCTEFLIFYSFQQFYVDLAYFIEIEISFSGNHQFCEHTTTPTSFCDCRWAKESEIFAGYQYGADVLQ
jgi:hypothetical protein